MLDLLLPEALPLTAAISLIMLSAVTSCLSTSLGLGGGVVMLAALTVALPAPAIIPVHAVVQLGSNAGRFWIMWRHVDRRLFAAISAGAVVGVALGGMIVMDLPAPVLRLLLALFIFWSVWFSPPQLERIGYSGASLAGIGASFLTMFVGATGPFVMAILRPFKLGRLELVATHAASMLLQHGLKMAAFGILGFAFAAWFPLVLAMIVCGFIGTVVGRHLLLRLPELRFRTILKWLLTVVAVLLIVRSVAELISNVAI